MLYSEIFISYESKVCSISDWYDFLGVRSQYYEDQSKNPKLCFLEQNV